MAQRTLSFASSEELDARKRNILRSPKADGSGGADSIPYLVALGVSIAERKQPIQFTPNFSRHIHRWASYVQGFSASFVESTIRRHCRDYPNLRVLDPFAGCGTVLVQSKLLGYPSLGTELNPLLSFVAGVKVNSWDVSPARLLAAFESMPKDAPQEAPRFLRSVNQFRPGVLANLERIRGGIGWLEEHEANRKVLNLLKVAFCSVLVPCSNLKRTPCLGYSRSKAVPDNAPWRLFEAKVHAIASDLDTIRRTCGDRIPVESRVLCEDAMEYRHEQKFDLAITSPPYMNGLDYVMNYKIEMGWLGFVADHRGLKEIKDSMVVCDNVSKELVRGFASRTNAYTNDWIDKICAEISRNIERRGVYRRTDMPHVVAKYFDDLYRVMHNVSSSLNPGGRFVLVVGDSLIADVYVPTDLILARIGTELGLQIESIEKARSRRSGQIRSYRLRESIVTLRNLESA
ncbi:MAG TPA: hypothetical protein VM163_05700 [bacterium]|nr:hypothetical protein [bacterium]